MMGFGFGGLSLILMILFWVVIIALAVWLISRIFPQSAGLVTPTAGGGDNEHGASPVEILKRRYAKGEISKAEYEEMREELRK